MDTLSPSKSLSDGGEDGASSSRRGSRFRVDIVDELSTFTPSTMIKASASSPSQLVNSVAAPDLSSFYNSGYTRDETDEAAEEDASRKISLFRSYGNVQTIERPPNMLYYRNINSIAGEMAKRPTLYELRAENLSRETIDEQEFELGLDGGGGGGGRGDGQKRNSDNHTKLQNLPKPNAKQPVKFGWIQGVLVRCTLNIVGVMLYLRLSWVTGQAGIGLASLIILISSAVTTITALSMCAICTNGEVKGGGAYFMISRSLGAEFGGSIGVIFTLANALGAAMHCVGFAETVRDLIKDTGHVIVDGELMDSRIIGWCTCTLLIVIIFIGVSFEAKAQLVFLVILVVSIVNYWVGTVIPPSTEDRSKGLTGYSWATLSENFVPNFRDSESFFTVFGIYFPSATGIMAGANISGDLRDPSKAIPKGTLTAVFITTLLYLSVVWTTGSTCIRYASGNVGDLHDGNLTACAPPPYGNNTDLTEQSKCNYGMMDYYHVMELDSGYQYLVTAGIFAATLSSASASLLSAPKIFQALARDPVFPYIHHLAKGYGKGDEPRRLYAVTFVLVMAVIGLGDLNIIAPYVSTFFLASYCLVNYACFAASFSESPGWRPSFRYYNMWVSLVGAILCVGIMFVINYIAALITLAFVLVLYIFVWYRKPEVNWGSSSQASVYKAALQKVQKLQATEEHVKNYRPQILVLSGNPVARPSLVDFGANVTKDISLLICGHVIMMNPTSRVLNSIHKLNKQVVRWFKRRKVKAFYCPVAVPNMLTGVQALTQMSGLSRLKPNILLMGFKSNWNAADGNREQVVEYFKIINCAFESFMGIGILRVPGGLDFSHPLNELQMRDAHDLNLPEPSSMARILAPAFDIDDTEEAVGGLHSSESFNAMRRGSLDLLETTTTPTIILVGDGDEQPPPVGTPLRNPRLRQVASTTANGGDSIATMSLGVPIGNRLTEARPSLADIAQLSINVKGAKEVANKEKKTKKQKAPSARNSIWTEQQQQVVSSINRFRVQEKKAVIDVWWLFDDGGLTLFIPHMLTLPKSYLEGAKLRVFTIASNKSAIEQEQRSMITLLNKFRIDYQDVFLIPDITRKPKEETLKEFDQLVKPFKNTENGNGLITESELVAMEQKTHRQLRTRELLFQYSSDANLIVLTLPVPREGTVSPHLYMSWLEMLTRGMPPVLLLRGNQQSVLTFYS